MSCNKKFTSINNEEIVVNSTCKLNKIYCDKNYNGNIENIINNKERIKKEANYNWTFKRKINKDDNNFKEILTRNKGEINDEILEFYNDLRKNNKGQDYINSEDLNGRRKQNIHLVNNKLFLKAVRRIFSKLNLYIKKNSNFTLLFLNEKKRRFLSNASTTLFQSIYIYIVLMNKFFLRVDQTILWIIEI